MTGANSLRAFAVGIATFVPGLNALHRRLTRAPGTASARYCYSVWLRHLTMAHRAGLCSRTPRRVAELGPGESIGIGLAALLSGAESYSGFDVIPHTSLQRNLAVFEELIELYRSRSPLPGPDEFPQIRPWLEDYSYPDRILGRVDISAGRLERIRESIKEPNTPQSIIRYVAPWWHRDSKSGSVDMIFSQAVLEHIDDLPRAYSAMKRWLTPGGFISHQIDFTSHDTAATWDGHWSHGDFAWSLIRGKRPYLINREPHSTHLKKISSAGFEVKMDLRVHSSPTFGRDGLARRFRELDDADRTISGAYILAKAA